MASSTGEEQSAILEVTSQAKKVFSNISGKTDSRNSNNSSIIEDNENLQSPSADSISTFQELERTSDLILENNVDIVARVDEPQKVVEPWGTYVTFRIRTKTKRWDTDEKEREYTVRRRYNDFKALRERLVEISLQIVPPLPSRHSFFGQLDRYSKDFVLQRMALLNIFIKRLVSHSLLTHNEDLKIFLTASSSEFSHHFKAKTGYLASISDSLYSLASPNNVPALGITACRIRDPEFSSIADYMTGLHEKLELLNSISTRIMKERCDISTEMKMIRPILESWSQIERFNRDTLKKEPPKTSETKHQADESFPLGNTLKKMAKPFYMTATEYYKLTKEYPYIIANPVKEYLLYIEAVKEKLSRRDGLQGCLENAQDKLAKRKEKFSHNGVNTNQQMSPQIPKLAQEVEDCHDRLQCASEALRSDIHGWQRQKKTDLKMVLVEMAKKNIDFYEKTLLSWETVLESQLQYKGIMADLNQSNLSSNYQTDIVKQLGTAISPSSSHLAPAYQDSCTCNLTDDPNESWNSLTKAN